MSYFDNETFKQIKEVGIGHYVNCTFKSCDLSGLDFKLFEFEECEFFDCNISNARWANAKLQNISFSDCKMIGNSFENANAFLLEIHFQACALNMSTFYGLTLKKSTFIHSNLAECEFSDADL
jgi:uncharacterized protein YjbI with pentapeptide repeats